MKLQVLNLHSSSQIPTNLRAIQRCYHACWSQWKGPHTFRYELDQTQTSQRWQVINTKCKRKKLQYTVLYHFKKMHYALKFVIIPSLFTHLSSWVHNSYCKITWMADCFITNTEDQYNSSILMAMPSLKTCLKLASSLLIKTLKKWDSKAELLRCPS